MSEAILKALGVETCGDLLAKRGMIAALFSEISTDFFMEVVRPLHALSTPQTAAALCGPRACSLVRIILAVQVLDRPQPGKGGAACAGAGDRADAAWGASERGRGWPEGH